MKFKAIAMKCNEEQFKAVEPKLLAGGCEIKDINNYFHFFEYLVNNCGDTNQVVTNVESYNIQNYNREVHEQWDEKVFLEACGIETFTITKDTVLKYDMKEEFPELFKLESGRWLKDPNYPLWMVYVVGDGSYYGFDYIGNWVNKGFTSNWEDILADERNSYATIEEVKTKLINEAEKRGFIKGVKFISIEDTPRELTYENPWFDGDKTKMMWNSAGGLIFNSGVWAEVVKKIAPKDNNGWTKIYDESDLPTEDGIYEVLLNKTQFRATLAEIIREGSSITHWKKPTLLPIE